MLRANDDGDYQINERTRISSNTGAKERVYNKKERKVHGRDYIRVQNEGMTSSEGVCKKSGNFVTERLIVGREGIGLDIDSTVGRDLGLEAGDLPRGEVGHTHVV